MNRRDFGKLAVVGLGAAAVTTTATPARAAGKKVKGSGYKCKAVKGTDKKFYLLPSGTFDIKPGSQVQFSYTGEGSDKKLRFDLVDAGSASGSISFPIDLNGTPSVGLDSSPATVLFVDADGEQPITVQQPGG
ncbi:MAG: hypothetical protein GY898_17020 [Proteobacteria bacterium]|nr:hypothetical protein [Pseudomonadota bacterium]